MFDPGAEHGVIRLAGAPFELREGIPGAIQQIVPPALEKLLFELGGSAVFDRRLFEAASARDIRPLAPVIVVDQVLDGPLHIVAESSALRVAMAEVAAEESDRELLVQLRGGVRDFSRL